MNATLANLPRNLTALAPFRLGDWTVFPDQGRLVGAERTLRIEPRTMHLLVCLAARPGQVVPHEELLQVVWSDVVVSEGAISRTVSELRRDLGDSARSPQYIETIYKRGYRLLAHVEPMQSNSPARRSRIGLLALVAAVILVGAGWMFRSVLQEPTADGPSLLKGRPLTATPGLETAPDISFDGERVAYCRHNEGRAGEDIYVTDVAGGAPMAIATTAAREMSPVWSPDGLELAYVRLAEDLEIVVHTLADRSERVVATFDHWIWGLDWSPDGSALAVATASIAGGSDATPCLLQVDLQSGLATPLVEAAPEMGDRLPRYSPDGLHLAFLRGSDLGIAQAFVADLTTGEARAVTPAGFAVAGLDWATGEAALLASVAGLGGFELHRIDLEDGTRQILPAAGGQVRSLSVAAGSGDLIYEESTIDVDVHALGLNGESGPDLNSTRLDYSADYSPSGDRIAFASGRSGSRQVWLCNSTGAGLRRLTDFDRFGVEQVRWAPDGGRIACQVGTRRGSALAVVDAESGEAQVYRLDGDRFQDWSADGLAVYTLRGHGTEAELWRVPIGDETPTRVAREVAEFVHETSDGTVFYRGVSTKDLWRLSPGDRKPSIAFADEQLGDWISATLVDGRLFATTVDTERNYLIRHRPNLTVSDTLAVLPLRTGTQLSVGPEGSRFLMNRTNRQESDLIFVAADDRPW